MFSWFKKKTAKPEETHSVPTTIHLKHKTITPATKIEAKPSETKPKNIGLSQKEINDLRQLEFEQLGIPYKLVLTAEARRKEKIDPHKLATETNSLNSKLITFGFNIRINYLEFFECYLLYLDYQKMREIYQKTKGVFLPEHSLINIVVLREAEKMIRKKYNLAANPTADEGAKKFQSEVKALFESLWNKSFDYQLRQQAQRRLRRKKNLPNNEPLLEAEVTAMMETIKTERAAIKK